MGKGTLWATRDCVELWLPGAPDITTCGLSVEDSIIPTVVRLRPQRLLPGSDARYRHGLWLVLLTSGLHMQGFLCPFYQSAAARPTQHCHQQPGVAGVSMYGNQRSSKP